MEEVSALRLLHPTASSVLFRAGWFSISVAKKKIIKGQSGFLDELAQILKANQK